MHNILIIEDNARLSALITKSLCKNTSYNIYIANRIKQAKNYLKNNYFDLICLDIILPDGDGLDFCKELKENVACKTTKILVISKKTAIHNRVDAFTSGADDYLPKPFHPLELEIRIKNLLGLTKFTKPFMTYKHFSLNKLSMKLIYDQYELPLTKTECLLLQYLFEHDGFANLEFLTQFLSAKKLKNIENKSVVVSIKRLKDKLRKNTGNPFIKTKYGAGYYLP